jgi:hypothetical protein
MVNGVLEKVIGRRPGFDPLYVLATLVGSDWFGANPAGPRPFVERFKDGWENVVGNIPFGQFFAWGGGRFPISAAFPDVKKLEGMLDPELWREFAVSAAFPNFGGKEDTLNTSGRELIRTALYLNPLGWGGQIKKSWFGAQAALQGYVPTASGKKVRYRVDQNFAKFMQGFLFGPSSFSEAVDYWSQAESRR